MGRWLYVETLVRTDETPIRGENVRCRATTVEAEDYAAAYSEGHKWSESNHIPGYSLLNDFTEEVKP